MQWDNIHLLKVIILCIAVLWHDEVSLIGRHPVLSGLIWQILKATLKNNNLVFHKTTEISNYAS